MEKYATVERVTPSVMNSSIYFANRDDSGPDESGGGTTPSTSAGCTNSTVRTLWFN
jgi:hypothetical protein